MTGEMSVKEALAKYGDALTPFERREILQYEDERVYYLGLEAGPNKIVNNETLPNDGFDDDNGSYHKVIHDHIAYRYEILDVIGRGSFGQVVKARDHKTNTDVALKIIRNKKRFHQQALIEVKILEHLNRCCDQAASQQKSQQLQKQQLQQQQQQKQQQNQQSARQQQQLSGGSTGSSSSSSNTSPSSSNYSLSSSSSSLLSSPQSAHQQAAANGNGVKQQHQQEQVKFNNPQTSINNTNAGCQFVIQMIDNFYFRNHLCITFELLNMNLYELIKRNSYQGFSLNIIRRFAYSLVQCLRMLNREKIIHCDLKPENILLRDKNSTSIKVIDFGSSCFTNQRIYTYIQSRFYRSPEVILGLPYGTAIDMWSLACILSELYTGEPLFAGENESDQLGCIMEVCSIPPGSVLESATRRRLFFDSKNNPRNLVNTKGKRRRVGSRPLSVILNCDETDFIDFLERCLEWDPRLRLTPDEAIRHPWLSHYVRRVIGIGPQLSMNQHNGNNTVVSIASNHHQHQQQQQQQLQQQHHQQHQQTQQPLNLGLNLTTNTNSGNNHIITTTTTTTSSGFSSGGSDSSSSSSAKSAYGSGNNLFENLRLNNNKQQACSLVQKANMLNNRNLLNMNSSSSTSIRQQTLDEDQMEVDSNNNNINNHSNLSFINNTNNNNNNKQENFMSFTQHHQAVPQKSQISSSSSLMSSTQPQRGLLSVINGYGQKQASASAAGPVVSGKSQQKVVQMATDEPSTNNQHHQHATMDANKQFISTTQPETYDTLMGGDRLNPLTRINRDLSGNVVRRVSCVAAPASNLLVSNGESCVRTIINNNGAPAAAQTLASNCLANGSATSLIDTTIPSYSTLDLTKGTLQQSQSTITSSSASIGPQKTSNSSGENMYENASYNYNNNNKNPSGVTSATCIIRDSHSLINKSQPLVYNNHHHHQADLADCSMQQTPMDTSESGSNNMTPTNSVQQQLIRQRKTSLQHFGLTGPNGNLIERDGSILPHSNSAKSLYRLGEVDGVVESDNSERGERYDFTNNNYVNHFSPKQDSLSSVSLANCKISTPSEMTSTKQFSNKPNNANDLFAYKPSTTAAAIKQSDLKLSIDQVQMMLNQVNGHNNHLKQLQGIGLSSRRSNTTTMSTSATQPEPDDSTVSSSNNIACNSSNATTNSNGGKQHSLNRVIDNLITRKSSSNNNSPFFVSSNNCGNTKFTFDTDTNCNSNSNGQQTGSSNSQTQHKLRPIVKRNPYFITTSTSEQNFNNGSNNN